MQNLLSGSWLYVIFSNFCVMYVILFYLPPSCLLMLFVLTSDFLENVVPNLNIEVFVSFVF